MKKKLLLPLNKQPSSNGISPSGLSDGGRPYYKLSDITVQNTCKLSLLPVDSSIPLILCASDLETSTKEYKGNDVPIYAKTDDQGKRYYICMHVIQEADEKKGKKKRVCRKEFIAGSSVNIWVNTITCKRSHGFFYDKNCDFFWKALWCPAYQLLSTEETKD